MAIEFNFKSQRATTIEQSERLIALGLRKETADCVWIEMSKDDWRIDANGWKAYYSIIEEGITPAWSLHRLIEMMPECLTYYGNLHYISIREHQVKYVRDGVSDGYFGCWGGYTLYDKVINCIKWLIKEGYFNKEYLEE